MTTKLKPCPFCGFKKIYIHPITEWRTSKDGRTKRKTYIGWEFYCGSFNIWPTDERLRKQHKVMIYVKTLKEAERIWNKELRRTVKSE